jgi:hypothetical protein
MTNVHRDHILIQPISRTQVEWLVISRNLAIARMMSRCNTTRFKKKTAIHAEFFFASRVNATAAIAPVACFISPQQPPSIGISRLFALKFKTRFDSNSLVILLRLSLIFNLRLFELGFCHAYEIHSFFLWSCYLSSVFSVT